jgi:hypothetical protein
LITKNLQHELRYEKGDKAQADLEEKIKENVEKVESLEIELLNTTKRDAEQKNDRQTYYDKLLREQKILEDKIVDTVEMLNEKKIVLTTPPCAESKK